METKVAPKSEQQETEEVTPSENSRPASYSMMHPKMRRIYGEFYRELYYSDAKVLDTKTQELISIAASLVAKCQGCLEGHIKKAVEAGASRDEISEAISIAAAVNAAAIIDLTDKAAERLNLNLFPSEGPRFKLKQ